MYFIVERLGILGELNRIVFIYTFYIIKLMTILDKTITQITYLLIYICIVRSPEFSMFVRLIVLSSVLAFSGV